MRKQPFIILLFAACALETSSFAQLALRPDNRGDAKQSQSNDQNAFVGMWITKDGYVRHELLPGGRYDESRGARTSAYRGRYVLTGNRIVYVDDTGFTADGEFRDGVLHHGGMIFHRETVN